MLTDIAHSLAPHGLILRGGFHADRDDEGVVAGAATVVLVGNAGPAMWSAFAPSIDGAPNPLDRWTKLVIDPVASKFGARAIYPFGPDVAPFQQWALRAGGVYRSPLGILIDPEFGLWHALRAALLFSSHLDLPVASEGQSPCERCLERPCLSACPVGAFDGKSYDLVACATHITAPEVDCTSVGCHARNACPVGEEWRYPEAQTRFHMAAFARSVGGLASR